MNYQRIPINPALPAQEMEVPLGGNVYRLTLRWNTRDVSWSLDIATRERVPLIDGLKLVLNHELLDRFADERLPDGYLIAFDSTGKKTTIERFDLGNTVQLVFVPRSEYTP